MIKIFKNIHTSEADLRVSKKKPPGKKTLGKLHPRKMTPENCPPENL